MPFATRRKSIIYGMLAAAALTCVSAQTFESDPRALYDVTTELGMPHLEDNLRYAITHEKRCLTSTELYGLFPILGHPALAGCQLGASLRDGDKITYPLVCDEGHGTTGNAVWALGEHQLIGTLSVRLGGKNMTFFQRMTALPLGPCSR
jgi:hypothetical protein